MAASQRNPLVNELHLLCSTVVECIIRVTQSPLCLGPTESLYSGDSHMDDRHLGLN